MFVFVVAEFVAELVTEFVETPLIIISLQVKVACKILVEEGELPYELITGKLNVTTKTIQALQEQGIVEITEPDIREDVNFGVG